MRISYKNKKNMLTRFIHSLIYPLIEAAVDKYFKAKIKKFDFSDGQLKFFLENDKHKIAHVIETHQGVSERECKNLKDLEMIAFNILNKKISMIHSVNTDVCSNDFDPKPYKKSSNTDENLIFKMSSI